MRDLSAGKEVCRLEGGPAPERDPFGVARLASADSNSSDTPTLCTRTAKNPRLLFPKPRQYEALQAMREQITSEEGREVYRVRAGIYRRSRRQSGPVGSDTPATAVCVRPTCST